MRVVFGLLTLVTSMLPPVVAQVPNNVNEMLRRIFASAEFAPQRFGPARWIENGTAYTTVEKSAGMPDAFDIVRYETATGARSVYISARQLVPSNQASRPLRHFPPTLLVHTLHQQPPARQQDVEHREYDQIIEEH